MLTDTVTQHTPSPSSARAGLVGGLGPESTLDYSRQIIDLWKQGHPNTLPVLVIDSLDVHRAIQLVRHDRDGLVDYLLASIERLARADCSFAALTANTPHLVFDEVAARASIPLLSIVEAAAAEAESLGFGRVGLLGTGFTMEAPFYPDVFARRGIDVVVPREAERAWLQERYLGELLNGTFLEPTREGVERMVTDLAARESVEAVILAGTELPLLLRTDRIGTVLVLDTTGIHVRAIVAALDDSA